MYSEIDFVKLEDRGYYLERKYTSKNNSLYMYFNAIKKWDVNPTSPTFGKPIKFSKKVILVRVSTHDKCNRVINKKPVDVNMIISPKSTKDNELTLQLKNKLNSFKLGEREKPKLLINRDHEFHKFMKTAEHMFEIYFLIADITANVTPEVVAYINNKFRYVKDDNCDIERLLKRFNLIYAP